MGNGRPHAYAITFWLQLPLYVLYPVVALLCIDTGIVETDFCLTSSTIGFLAVLSTGALAIAVRLQGIRERRERNIFTTLLLISLYGVQAGFTSWTSTQPTSNDLESLGTAPVLDSQQQASSVGLRGKVDIGVIVKAPQPTTPPFGGTPPSPDVKTISVVLPCAEERETALRTVQRFCERTPPQNLEEIIVVDDGSVPPLASMFAQDERRLDQNKSCKLRFLRHDRTIGLMAAKLTGGSAAQGDIIAFIDCHCAPQFHWEEPIIQLVRENPRRLVVPEISRLDYDTFDEAKSSWVFSKCYLDFDGEFIWFDDDSEYIPTVSGGLVAMGRQWFNMTGGFDNLMHGWGGENLDQSLRSWLCGGEIVRARGSRIAHMFRGEDDPRTLPHYQVHGQPTNNRGRVAAAWFGEFLPVYRGRAASLQEVQNLNVIKETLQCKPFSYFLYRFRRIYIEGGLVARTAFQLRDRTRGLCFTSRGHRVVATECLADGKNQWFQLGNMDPRTKKCCKGLRAYKTNDCVDSLDELGPHMARCDVTGWNGNQGYKLLETGHIRKDFPGQDGVQCLCVNQDNLLDTRLCEELKTNECVFEKANEFETMEWKIWVSEMEKYRYNETLPNMLDN